MPSKSVAATSALTGPGTMRQISLMMSRICRPVLETNDGLVVTPSSSPLSARALISATSAVSTKNFMAVIRFPNAGEDIGEPPRDRKRCPVLLPYPFPGPFDYALALRTSPPGPATWWRCR